MKRIVALSAFAVGYVFGARAGRERYDQLKGAFDRVRRNSRVQDQAHHLADVAKERAPGISEKGDLASSVVSKGHPSRPAAQSRMSHRTSGGQAESTP